MLDFNAFNMPLLSKSPLHAASITQKLYICDIVALVLFMHKRFAKLA